MSMEVEESNVMVPSGHDYMHSTPETNSGPSWDLRNGENA